MARDRGELGAELRFLYTKLFTDGRDLFDRLVTQVQFSKQGSGAVLGRVWTHSMQCVCSVVLYLYLKVMAYILFLETSESFAFAHEKFVRLLSHQRFRSRGP